jgi:hypothetical protein
MWGEAMVLFESGLIYLRQKDNSPIEVRRGMTILTKDDQVAGKVAAVVVDDHSQNVTHLLFSQLGQIPQYRLVPVNLFEQVKEETVFVSIRQHVIESLPLRRTS